jgi:hypothetical protein
MTGLIFFPTCNDGRCHTQTSSAPYAGSGSQKWCRDFVQNADARRRSALRSGGEGPWKSPGGTANGGAQLGENRQVARGAVVCLSCASCFSSRSLPPTSLLRAVRVFMMYGGSTALLPKGWETERSGVVGQVGPLEDERKKEEEKKKPAHTPQTFSFFFFFFLFLSPTLLCCMQPFTWSREPCMQIPRPN